MNSIDTPVKRSSLNFCWVGMIGLFTFISFEVGAAPPSSKSGFLPGARSFASGGSPFANPNFADEKPGSALPSRGGNFFDDEDDDEFDDDPMMPSGFNSDRKPQPPSPFGVGSPRSFSAGGSSNSGPDPILTDKGYSLGGSSANGVISAKNKITPVRIDDETAEGSKDVITDFNFPDADILDIAKTLGKLTGKNFILDKDVKGRITIISNSQITVGEAWKVFLTALDINGFALIPSGKYLRIARQRDARDKQLKTYTGDMSPDTDALITRVFGLKYISPEEVARTFRSFMPANSRIIPYEQTNTVIVTDTGSNIAKLAKMLEILDVEGFDAGIEVVPVKFASASDLSKLIDTLIPGTSSSSGGGPPGAPRFGGGGGGGGRFSARRTKEGGIINTIIADERTNTLIVHANTKGADQVRELVAKLDQKLPQSIGGGKVHVVYLQYADAEQISATLSNFSSQTSGSTRPPGFPGGGGTGTGVNPNESALFQGNIKISPDKATNSLVITAAPADYVTIQRVINRLDIPREQVYVEVVVMEVAIDRSFNFSANIANPQSGLGIITNPGDIGALLTGGIPGKGASLALQAGGNTSITLNGTPYNVPNIAGLIKVFQDNTNSNILATPQIIALDNTEANFESGEKLPILTSNAVQGAVSQSITYQSVALSIKIKPQINKVINYVKLDITAKLGDISARILPKAVSDQAYATLDRTAQTTVVIGDGDTVVLGGLIRDKVSDSVSKVPILGDIPILGWLFKSSSRTASKTNLLIFMTPHIIRQYEKVRAILDRKLKERDDFIEKNAGGEDASRGTRDAMIRSLPDIKELTEKKPVTSFTIDEEKPNLAPVMPESGRDLPSSSADPQLQPRPVFNPEERAPINLPPSIPPSGGETSSAGVDPSVPPATAGQ